MIFFSVSFAIYSLFCLTLIREKQPEINVEKDNLLSYKMLIIVFLSIITLIYILAILYQDCGLIRDLIHENQSEFYKNILSYIIYMFPYFIHILNGVLMFSYYFELKYVNFTLNKNRDIDFHFDCNEIESLTKI